MTQPRFELDRFQGPFRLDRVPESCVMVIFGASGDLTRRKLIPAIFDLKEEGLLPPSFAILGIGERRWRMRRFEPTFARRWRRWVSSRHPECRSGRSSPRDSTTVIDANVPAEYNRLRDELTSINANHNSGSNFLFYLVTPPSMYVPIIQSLGRCGLNHPQREDTGVRIIIEKPFGVDLASARRLNDEATAVFREEQLYRIDHYLGKETVQNLLVFRFANGISNRSGTGTISTMCRSPRRKRWAWRAGGHITKRPERCAT